MWCVAMPCVKGAFRIVSIIRNNNNPNANANNGGSGGKAGGDASIDQIVSDQWARQEYLKWAERKTDQVTPYSHEPTDKILKSLSLNEIGYKAIAQQSFTDLLKVAADQDGWRLVADDQKSGSGSGGDSDVRITYKTDVPKDLVTVKVTTLVPFPIDAVTNLLLDVRVSSFRISCPTVVIIVSCVVLCSSGNVNYGI